MSESPVVPWKNLSVMRGVAICLVVAIHACERLWPFVTQTTSTAERELFYLLFDLVLSPAVPFFVFVSGFFMARFSPTWPTAISGAKVIAYRYVPWTIAVYAIAWLAGGTLLFWPTVWFFITGFDRPHWFFVLLIQLYLLTPLLLPWVKKNPGRAVALALVLQAVECTCYYLRFAGMTWPPERYFVVMQMPFYLAGLLASTNSDRITKFLLPRRHWFPYLFVGSMVLMQLEHLVMRRVFAKTWASDYLIELVSQKVCAVVLLAWAWQQDSKSTRFREWMNYVGLRSSGILLVHMYLINLAFRFFWHFDRLIGLTNRPRTQAPMWLYGHLHGLIPSAVLALGIPLLLMELTERLIGKQVRKAIFG